LIILFVFQQTWTNITLTCGWNAPTNCSVCPPRV